MRTGDGFELAMIVHGRLEQSGHIIVSLSLVSSPSVVECAIVTETESGRRKRRKAYGRDC